VAGCWRRVHNEELITCTLHQVREYIQKFSDCVDNEIQKCKNKHSLRSKAKGYGGKTH
jgi:hypothetical protein